MAGTQNAAPATYPFFDEIVRAGETYAYPLDLTSEQARALWTMSPPGQTVVLEEEGRILGSATMGPNRPGRGRLQQAQQAYRAA